MTCPSCKQPNASDRNYCGACGAPLSRYCSLCGFRNQAADRFCGGCGAPLGAAARPEGAPATLLAATSPAKAEAPADSDLAELLEAAQEPTTTPQDDLSARVSQDDIDSLFGD